MIERHLPPAPSGTGAIIDAAKPPEITADAAPIGPPLTAIVVLGASEAVHSHAAGLELGATAHLDRHDVRDVLEPFLGQPISRKLITDIENEITGLYRRAGFPFVSVSTPEQEITTGALQFRVIEFRAGRITASGLGRTPAGYVEAHVRLNSGDPIAAGELSEDLAWLNRNPFRQVEAVFSPGAELGRTDLDLRVTEVRAWQAYAGYASSGSAASGRDRYFVGGEAGLPWSPDAVISYQFTGAANAYARSHPDYASHAVRLDLPLAPRRALELSYDHVETNQPVQDFVSRQVIDEATLGYRAALSTFRVPGLAQPRGDIRLGVELRRARRALFFGSVDVQQADYAIVQGYIGYSGLFSGRRGDLAIDVTLHATPGRLIDRASTVAPASNGYAYGNGRVSGVVQLAGRLSLASEITFQAATAALPQTEQTAIGGPGLVRGYSLEDGAFDSAFVWRSELRGPSLRLLPRGLGISDAVQPRLFLDAGHGWARGGQRNTSAVSAGVGAEYRLGPRLRASLDHACALEHGNYTRAGYRRFEARLTVSY